MAPLDWRGSQKTKGYKKQKQPANPNKYEYSLAVLQRNAIKKETQLTSIALHFWMVVQPANSGTSQWNLPLSINTI